MAVKGVSYLREKHRIELFENKVVRRKFVPKIERKVVKKTLDEEPNSS